MEIKKNPKCINRSCEGGVLMRYPNRPVPCQFCNPRYVPERSKPYTVAVIKQIAMDFHNANTYEDNLTYTDAFEIWWAENRSSYISDRYIKPLKRYYDNYSMGALPYSTIIPYLGVWI